MLGFRFMMSPASAFADAIRAPLRDDSARLPVSAGFGDGLLPWWLGLMKKLAGRWRLAKMAGGLMPSGAYGDGIADSACRRHCHHGFLELADDSALAAPMMASPRRLPRARAEPLGVDRPRLSADAPHTPIRPLPPSAAIGAGLLLADRLSSWPPAADIEQSPTSWQMIWRSRQRFRARRWHVLGG